MGWSTRQYLISLLLIVTIQLLSDKSPAFAQSIKPRPTKQAQNMSPKAEPVLTLTPANLEKEAYKMWFYWYKAQAQGRSYPQPTIDIPTTYAQEANWVRSVWQRAQRQAQQDAQQLQAGTSKAIKKADILADSYRLWLKWYQQQQQGIRTAPPSLTIRNADAQESRRVTALWQQGRVKAERDFQAHIAKNNQPQQAKISVANGVVLSSATTGGTPNTRLFGGQEYDSDLGLYYLRDRYYDPANVTCSPKRVPRNRLESLAKEIRDEEEEFQRGANRTNPQRSGNRTKGNINNLPGTGNQRNDIL